MTGSEAEFGSGDLHFSMAGSPHVQIVHCFGIPLDRTYVQNDNLSWGPLTHLDDPGHWQSLRNTFWRQIPRSEPLDDPDTSALYKRLIAEQKQLRSAERVFLWLGSTLAEQLLLAWLIAAFKRLEIGTEGLRLLSLRPRRGSVDRSISILNCDRLKELAQWRRPTTDELGAYETAWDAVSSSSPEDLIEFCAPHPSQTSPVIDALRTFVARYPSVERGLNLWDRTVLEACEARRLKAARIVGNALGFDHQYPDWPGDIYLFERLKRLGDHRLSHPLVTIFGTGASMRHTEVVITETGQGVLEGEANFVDLNGIDDWVGGVHLSSRDGALWFYDGQTLVPG